jgi:hypothetical protein
MSPPRKKRPKPLIDMEGGFSRAAGYLIAILTIVSIICGGVFYVVHQLDMLQAGQALNEQAIHSLSEGIKTLNDKRQEGYENIDRIIRMVATMHNQEGK